MVDPRSDGGFLDALKGDSWIEFAAVATLVGADPITFLSSSGDELIVRAAAYERALEIDSDRRHAEQKVLVDCFVALINFFKKRPPII